MRVVYERCCGLDVHKSFVPARWRPYVIGRTGARNRRYWELRLIAEPRGALRAGDVGVAGSRRYANPETYLIPRGRWPELRPEVCSLLGVAGSAADRLAACEAELGERLGQLWYGWWGLN